MIFVLRFLFALVLAAPFAVLLYVTKFKLSRILSIMSIVLILLGGLGFIIAYVGLIHSSDLAMVKIFRRTVIFIIPGVILGLAAYFVHIFKRYKLDETDTSALIKTVRDFWWPVAVLQLIFAVIAVIISIQEGGFYGSGGFLGIPGIIVGLIFFNYLSRKKNWARIGLGVLGILGLLIGLASIPNFFKLEDVGLVFAILGTVLSLGWGTFLVILCFKNSRIKEYTAAMQQSTEA